MWSNPAGSIANAAAVTFGFGNGSTVGLITPANSVLGTVPSGVNAASYDDVRQHMIVGRSASNIVSVFAPFNPPAFASNPVAVPNPAGLNQPVTFTAAATGGYGALTYSWNFGDGSPNAAGASVVHAYAAAGTFQATVTVTDAALAGGNFSVSVTVNAPVVGEGSDSDGDGFSDSFENSVNTDPFNAASTPTGTSITAAGLQVLTITKASIKLNFAKAGKDAILFYGTVGVPMSFKASNAKAYFDVSEVDKVLTLSAKGSAKTGGDAMTVSIKTQKGMVHAQTAKYSVSFKNGNFASLLAAAGLTNANAKALAVHVPFTLIFGNAVYQKIQPMSYTAKKDSSGAAK